MKQSLTVLIFVIVSIISLLSVLQLSYAAEEITYYHNDVSGSPLLATNASGNVLWKESYRPYGDKLTKSAASQNNKIGFHGKPFDDDTGLSYMQARYYDPILGRFTGIDPVDYKEDNLHSFNRYAYANNNPYKYVDPDGNHPLVYMLGVGLGAISLADGEPPQAKAFKLAPTAVGVKQGMSTEAKVATKVHGNSKNNTKSQHVYEIRDKVNNNSVCKTGISCGPFKADGKSKRAEQQVNKWNKEPGNANRYESKVIEKIPGGPNARDKALKSEKQNADLHRQTLDPLRHVRP
ncbi:RHS repeat-associated core domain-containing protein [Acinetobacter pittii]|uniref:RHS repeat-associated core domain-containing protein n=1 Tax=Acinetobacter pittii TaxID=48296 RepID=UPI002954FB2F|nr:RHS repeat-associated core domain-containing protein [Acinetobacter pittii]MDV8153465.1 RHS repeat-associated core domain-containing protein [Acinetobacter pittii]